MVFGQTSGKDENERERSALARGVVRAVTAAAMAVSAGVLAASASASALQLGCKPRHAGLPTIECAYHEHGQTEFTVPQHVPFIRVRAVGARGGNWGGLGAVANGVIRVHPGEHLYVNVNVLGGAGGSEYRGFGDSARDLAGGGESDIRTCSVNASACASGGTLESRLLIAGGGGGSGRPISEFNFPRGGDAVGFCTRDRSRCNAVGGAPHHSSNGVEGGGGAQEWRSGLIWDGAGGLGGRGSLFHGAGGGNGTLGAGGHGGSTDRWHRGLAGGGGGAGWYGGGGGGATADTSLSSAGGGGGISHAAPGVTHIEFTDATGDEQPAVTLLYSPASVH